MKTTFLAAALAVAACLGFTAPASAQYPAPPPPGGTAAERMTRVEDKTAVLERQVADLTAEVAKLRELTGVQSKAAPKAGACPCGPACECCTTCQPQAAPKLDFAPPKAGVCLPGQSCYTGPAAAAGSPAGTYLQYGGPTTGATAGSSCAGGSCAPAARFAPFGGRFRR